MTETKTVEVKLSKQLSAATNLYACFCIACGQPDEQSLHDPERCAGQGGENDAFPISDALATYDRSCEEEPDLEDDARALHCAIIAAKMVLASKSLSADGAQQRAQRALDALAFRFELRDGMRLKIGDDGGVGTGTCDEAVMYDALADIAALPTDEEVRRLRAALEPFAKLNRHQAHTAERLGFKDGNAAVRVPRALLRAAAAALQSKDTPSHG